MHPAQGECRFVPHYCAFARKGTKAHKVPGNKPCCIGEVASSASPTGWVSCITVPGIGDPQGSPGPVCVPDHAGHARAVVGSRRRSTLLGHRPCRGAPLATVHHSSPCTTRHRAPLVTVHHSSPCNTGHR
eukprot:gene18229-biopygen14470